MPSTRKPPRGRLMSMRVSGNVRDFVLDHLSGLSGLRSRSMFGGVRLYAGEVFFGIVAADVLSCKVDESTRAAYEAAGSKPFNPIEVLELAPTLIEWARRAVSAARAARRPQVKAAEPPSHRTGHRKH